MTTTVEAIYEKGVLRPRCALSLAEGTHVELVVKTADGAAVDAENSPPRTTAEIFAEIAAGSLRHGDPETASRDHDQFLYGKTGNR